MIINSISIRTKLQLTTLVTILILILLALIYVDTSKRQNNQADLLEFRSSLQSSYHGFYATIQRMSLENETSLMATCIQQARQFEEQISGIQLYIVLPEPELFERDTDQILATLDRLMENIRNSVSFEPSQWAPIRTEMEILGGMMEEFDQALSVVYHHENRLSNLQLFFSISLGIILIATYMVVFGLSLSRSLKKLALYARQLTQGKLPPQLNYNTRDEFSQIANDLNHHTAELHKKVGLITSLSDEGSGSIFEPDEDDELGKALLVLSDFLIRKELEEVTRNREDKKQNWISEGMAQLGNVLRAERDNVTELSYLIVQKLVTYMNLEMGSLFITNNNDPDNLLLELISSYAYDRRKYMHKTLEWGAGLPGTCAQEKERIFLTDVPENYFEVSSGTGSSLPNCLLLVPLKINEVVYGVLELATVRLLRPFEIEFVESLSESIASSVLAVRTSERTAELLKQSQAQAEALKDQESAMRDNMEKLEQAQKESSKKEYEITGILNAINQSSLVAELGPNGRFSSINDRFLMLLESSRDQVMGKQHSEFAQVDPYSEEYKAAWASLREGKSIANIEMYKLFSGKEIWLQQTFTPIINNEGKVYKILNIAIDITENRILQEGLESRELEIKRSGLDMQTLNDAVNTALIKCELDPEGIIMNVNDNYTELTGYGRKELLGRNYRLFLKDLEKEQFEKIWQEVIKEKIYEGVVRRSKPTGEEVWLAATLSPVKDEAGVIYKIYFMGLDITEKKLKYQLLEDANQEIERLKERLKDYEV